MQELPPAVSVRIAAVLFALSSMAACAQSPTGAPPASAAPLQRADAASLGDTLLAKATALYASTAKSGLRGFDCGVHPNWEEIRASSRKDAPAPGSDSEIVLLNTVKIALHVRLEGESSMDWEVPEGNSRDPASGAMLERAHRGIEQTLTSALKLWISLVNGSVAESLGAENVEITQNENGYSVRSRDKRHSLAEEFDRKLLLTRSVIADAGSVVDIAPVFQPTSQGLLLGSFVARVQQAGGAAERAQEIRFSVEYQNVSGAQIPQKLAVEVSHLVTMEFLLDGCTVNLK
jgi:hypothetical protein